jgi:hypothetical protein
VGEAVLGDGAGPAGGVVLLVWLLLLLLLLLLGLVLAEHGEFAGPLVQRDSRWDNKGFPGRAKTCGKARGKGLGVGWAEGRTLLWDLYVWKKGGHSWSCCVNGGAYRFLKQLSLRGLLSH